MTNEHGVKSRGPIKGQSHWCDGSTADGEPCYQVVRNDSDHCEAGHSNKIRSEPTTDSRISDSNAQDAKMTSFEIDEIPSTQPTTMGDRIKSAREREHISRKLLAGLTHITESRLAEIENGITGIEITEAALIADALRLSIPDLLGQELSPQLRLAKLVNEAGATEKSGQNRFPYGKPFSRQELAVWRRSVRNGPPESDFARFVATIDNILSDEKKTTVELERDFEERDFVKDLTDTSEDDVTQRTREDDEATQLRPRLGEYDLVAHLRSRCSGRRALQGLSCHDLGRTPEHMCDFCAAATEIEDLRDRVSAEQQRDLKVRKFTAILELATEAIEYVPSYFCDKYEMRERLTALQRNLRVQTDTEDVDTETV
jgi:transcriptional regulator with XRE-family HTH domain